MSVWVHAFITNTQMVKLKQKSNAHEKLHYFVNNGVLTKACLACLMREIAVTQAHT